MLGAAGRGTSTESRDLSCQTNGFFTTADPGPTGTVLEVCRDEVTE